MLKKIVWKAKLNFEIKSLWVSKYWLSHKMFVVGWLLNMADLVSKIIFPALLSFRVVSHLPSLTIAAWNCVIWFSNIQRH